MTDTTDELYEAPVIENYSDEDVLDECIERFKLGKNAWEEIHQAYVDDVKFTNGDQWDDRTKRIRDNENRSTFVYNKLIANVKYITNNARMNLPSIKCNPVTDGADKNTAKVLDGIIKYIEYNSNAKNAYINALKNVVMGGLGAFRVHAETDVDGEIDLSVGKISDPTTLYLDPDAEKACYEDAQWAVVISWMNKDAFKEQYPDLLATPIDKSVKAWFTKDKVQIAEYWYKHSDGRVCQALCTGNDVISRIDDYPGKYIPFILITGEEFAVQDIKEYKGIVRDVKDIQRLLNYSKSETADYLARSAKQQWLVSDKQIGAYQDIWNSNNVSQYNYLPYSESDAGKPTQIDPQVPPTALIESSKDSDADIRSAIGIRDPLHDVPQTQSGKAINLQISEGNIGTYNFYDSLHDGIRLLGKILIDLIPAYYSDAKIAQIMGDDGQVTPVQINKPYLENGKWVEHNLSQGKYSVRISTGATYESQRAETAERLSDLVAKYPQMMQLAGDIIVKNLDFEGADELSARLRAAIPPQILAASNASNADDKDQLQNAHAQAGMMQQKIQQDQILMQQMQHELQQLKQEQQSKIQQMQVKYELDAKLEQLKFEHDMQLRALDSRADIAMENVRMEADTEKARVQAHTDIFKETMKHELGQENKILDHAHGIENTVIGIG